MLVPHMGRGSPVAAQRPGLRKGAWTPEEDKLLRKCLEEYGVGKWHLVPQRAGLNRCRKSCRLRWLNYLSPGIKRGSFDNEEDDLIIRLHKLLGNRWSLIAGRIPGRTANDIKNYWNSHLSKRIDNDNRKECASRDSKVIRRQPQTAPINWFWSEHRTDCTGKHQEIISDELISPLPLEKHVARVDNTIINEGLSQEMPQVEFMMTGSQIVALGDEELLLPDLGGCGNLELDNDIWPNLDLFDVVML